MNQVCTTWYSCQNGLLYSIELPSQHHPVHPSLLSVPPPSCLPLFSLDSGNAITTITPIHSALLPYSPIASFIFPLPIPSQPSEFPCPLSDASYLPSEASVFHQKLPSFIRSFRLLSETSCLPLENSCLPSGGPLSSAFPFYIPFLLSEAYFFCFSSFRFHQTRDSALSAV